MAKNPMQRKAQNSFLLGMFITLLITGIIIGLLVMQLTKVTKAQQEEKNDTKTVYILSRDIESGEEIKSEDLKSQVVKAEKLPADILTPASLEDKASIFDEDGNIVRKVKVVSKINLTQGTILTSGMIAEENIIANDVRKVEYNMIALPSQLENGKYIDVRFKLPSGADYVVLSRKQITIPETNGAPNLYTMWLNMNEIEILTLSCAIVESYKIPGSALYVTEYVEPGMQAAATANYVPSNEIINLINNDPNCVQEAKQALFNRILQGDGTLNSTSASDRNPINNGLTQNAEDAADNVTEGIEKELEIMQEERQKYLESLGGSY